MLRILLYLVSIITANVVTAAFEPLHFGMFIIPMGTLLIGEPSSSEIWSRINSAAQRPIYASSLHLFYLHVYHFY